MNARLRRQVLIAFALMLTATVSLQIDSVQANTAQPTLETLTQGASVCLAQADGNWDNPAIWDCGRVPNPTDGVGINGFTVTIPNALSVSREAQTAVGNGSQLNILGTLTIEAGGLNGMVISNGGRVALAVGTLNNNAFIVVNGTFAPIESTVNNNVGAQIDFGTSTSLFDSNLNNSGTVDIDPGATLDFSTDSQFINNSGGVVNNNGTLTIDYSTGGTGDLDNQGTITNNNIVIFAESTTPITEGTFNNNGTLTLAAPNFTSAGSTLSVGGQFNNTGTITVNDASAILIDRSGAVVDNQGDTNVLAGGTLALQSAVTFNNASTVTLAAGSTFQIAVNGIFNNRCAATFADNGANSTITGMFNEGCTVTVVLDETPDNDTSINFTSTLPDNGTFMLQDPGNTTLAAGNPGTGSFTITASPPVGFGVSSINIAGDTNATGSSTDSDNGEAVINVEEGEFITVTFTVISATITVTEISAGNPFEEGGGSYTIQLLLSIPTIAAMDIVVDLSDQCFFIGSDPGEAFTYTFPIGQDNVTFFPRAVDDSLAEGAQSCDIDIRIENSNDPNYPNQVLADITVPIVDNDVAEITVTETRAGDPFEEGGSSYTIQLLFSIPTTAALDIVVDLSDQCFFIGSDPGEAFTYTFPVGQDNVTFFPRAVDDSLAEGAQSCDIDIRIENSSDPNYPNQVLADITVPIVDNDASVTIVKDDTSDSDTAFDFTTNLGTPTSFTLQDPSSNSTTYVVAPGTYSTTEAAEAGFYQTSATCDNGDSPNAVTVAGGDTVTCTFTSNPLGEVNLLIPIPTATEGGTPGLVGVQFDPETTSALDLVFDPDEQCFFDGLAAGEARVEPTTSGLAALVVPVIAVDDETVEGDHSCEVAISIANSSDPAYENGLIGTVTVNLIDNDAAGISVTPTEVQPTSEIGDTVDYSVVLTSEPTADVTVTFSVDDATEGNITAGETLVFTADNWNSPQTVTVTGVDDALADSDIAYSLSYLGSSTDPNYDALAGVRLLDNLDNDVSGVLVTPSDPQQTSEAGGTVDYSVVLTSEPTADVTITFTSSDTSEGTVDGPLVFTADNWDSSQTVTVTGVDDALLDGDVAYSLSYLSSSTDPNYDALAGVRLLDNLDNDVAAGDATLLIDPTTLLVAEDAPGTNSFTVALGQAPFAGETITVTFSYDGGQLALSQNSVTFDASNFNQPIPISVDAVADGVSEEILSYNIDVTTSSNLGNTALNGLSGTVSVTSFDRADLIVLFVPNIGTVTVFASNPTQVYQEASGGVLRDGATTAEVFLPRDADGNGFDTFTITDYSMLGDDVWLAVWLGSANWGWIQYNADTMLLEGDIWEMMYNAQN